jgi:hypothetical protein
MHFFSVSDARLNPIKRQARIIWSITPEFLIRKINLLIRQRLAMG